jgi:short-subunit dehydrogenase
MGIKVKRVAIVTGASSGIGEASAERLALRGFSVVLSARHAERMEAVAKRIVSNGGSAFVFPADLAKEAHTQKLVEATMQKWGRIDVLINNAGYGKSGPTEYLTRDDVRAQFEVNVFAPFQLCTLVVPIMRKQGEGRIINISSVNSRLAVPMGGLYSASKAAIDLLTDAFRIELAPLGISVILVIPGTTNTGAFDTMAEDARSYLKTSSRYYAHLLNRADYLVARHRRKASSPFVAAEVIERAAVEKNPRLRYIVSWNAWWKYYFKAFIPQRLIDLMIKRAFRLKKYPSDAETVTIL